MHFSPPTLHPVVITNEEDRDLVRRQMRSLISRRPKLGIKQPANSSPVSIQLTTVSQLGSFDSYIQVQFSTAGDPVTASLLVDSGNSTMIIPCGEHLMGVPGYTVLGTATEPWGCPANVVQGTLQIVTSDGSIYEIENCVFYACTGNNQSGERTANFGTGCISPWSASGWNTPEGVDVTMQSPLSYNTSYLHAEFVYAPVETMFSNTDKALVTDESMLILHTSVPSGYTLLSTIRNLEWMSVVPASLSIHGEEMKWPGNDASPIAMIDTGGGPVFLSYPEGFRYSHDWLDPVACPTWASSSQDCTCVSAQLELCLIESGGTTSYTYTIDTNGMPTSVQGLTAVMCKLNTYMMGRQGMNVGGITALFNRILINYDGIQVGLAPKYPN
ncbi:MAG: hypothetical protein WBK51_04170 [Polaromonas sp.]